MPSINVNRAVLDALQAFDRAGNEVARASQQIATGLRVDKARDAPAVHAAAQTLRSEASAWKTVQDSLATGLSLLDVAAAGIGDIVDLLKDVREKLTAYRDPSLNAASRALLRRDIELGIRQIDQTALQTAFDGKRPLADKLTPTSVTTSTTTYALPPSPLTPPSFAGAIGSASGGGSQTIVLDAGPTAGRVDLMLEAYGMADILEIWQGGVRVAATGQPYVPGGGPVGPGSAVSNQNVISFDYDPLAGQMLEFRFNENVSAVGSVWNVGGLVMADLSDPLPSGTVTSSTSTVQVSAPISYKYLSNATGEVVGVAARPLTAVALNLDVIDWNDPLTLVATVDQAFEAATEAGAYFGARQVEISALQRQAAGMEGVLEGSVGTLVDADMAKTSALLTAARVREQLAASSLSIANDQPRWMLSLFR